MREEYRLARDGADHLEWAVATATHRDSAAHALVAQLAEATDSKPVQCEFESHRGHHETPAQQGFRAFSVVPTSAPTLRIWSVGGTTHQRGRSHTRHDRCRIAMGRSSMRGDVGEAFRSDPRRRPCPEPAESTMHPSPTAGATASPRWRTTPHRAARATFQNPPIAAPQSLSRRSQPAGRVLRG